MGVNRLRGFSAAVAAGAAQLLVALILAFVLCFAGLNRSGPMVVPGLLLGNWRHPAVLEIIALAALGYVAVVSLFGRRPARGVLSSAPYCWIIIAGLGIALVSLCSQAFETVCAWNAQAGVAQHDRYSHLWNPQQHWRNAAIARLFTELSWVVIAASLVAYIRAQGRRSPALPD
jgi:hypothetical protein